MTGESVSRFTPMQFADAFQFSALVSALEFVGSNQANHNRAVGLAIEARRAKRTVYFIGNGGSAAIASHMAADFLKNGGVAAQCFNDGPLTTCIANDLGYEHVFAKPLSLHGRADDLLVAISSSGQSRSIIAAVEVALANGLQVITLSGFASDNPLRKLGDVNFYVPSQRYGVVEVCHHAICHAILDAVIDAH